MVASGWVVPASANPPIGSLCAADALDHSQTGVLVLQGDIAGHLSPANTVVLVVWPDRNSESFAFAHVQEYFAAEVVPSGVAESLGHVD